MLEETSASTCSENSGPRLRGSSGFRSGTKASQGVQDQVSKSNKSLVWPTCLRALPKVARKRFAGRLSGGRVNRWARDRKSTRLNSSHGYISYAVFCLKKKKEKILRQPFTRRTQIGDHRHLLGKIGGIRRRDRHAGPATPGAGGAHSMCRASNRPLCHR